MIGYIKIILTQKYEQSYVIVLQYLFKYKSFCVAITFVQEHAR